MKITFVNGDDAGKTFEFFLPQITVGREDANDLRIPTAGVSRYHAHFEQMPSGGWTVCDQGSTNGIKINGERIYGIFRLSEGDIVTIGEQQLRVFDLDGAPPKIVFNPVNAESASVQAGPAPGTAVPLGVEAVEPASVGEKNDSAGDHDLLESLKEGDLFSETPKDDENTSAAGEKEKSASRCGMSSMLFNTILICLAVVVISFVVNLFSGSGKEKNKDVPPVEYPIYLMFEKVAIKHDNVFRFALKIEANKAIFTLDDISSRRHVKELVVEDPAGLNVLRGRIENSGIWKTAVPQSAPDTSGLRRRLSLMIGTQVKEMVISGHHAPDEFDDVESAVYEFAEGCGMQAVVLSGEDVMRLAEESFTKANDLYANREANGNNLRDAITRFRAAVNYLKQFSPPPPIFKRAQNSLKEAEELRRKKLEELEFRRTALMKSRDFDALRRVFMEIMELTERESREYSTAQRRLYILDSRLKKQRGAR